MRVALVADRVGPLSEAGTADVVAAPLARALTERGHRVTLYANQLGVPAPTGVEIVQLGAAPPARNAGRPRRTRRTDRASRIDQAGGQTANPPTPDMDDPLRRLPERTGQLAERWSVTPPDLIHAMSWTAGLAALAATRDTAIPVVQTFDGLGRPRRRLDGWARRRIRLEAAVARSAALIVARSAEEVVELTRLGVPRAAVIVVPCGVDLELFSPDGPAAPSTERQRLLAFAPLTAEYGAHLAVRTLRRVPNAELVVVGGPPPADLPTDPAAHRLAEEVLHCRVGDRVRLTGAIPDDDLPPMLRSADVAVFPAGCEPCGATALAAMACGVPQLAVARGALADIVAEGATGDLVPPRHLEQFATALHDLLGNVTRLAGYRISSADRAQARYGWEHVAADTEAAYLRALQGHHSAVAG